MMIWTQLVLRQLYNYVSLSLKPGPFLVSGEYLCSFQSVIFVNCTVKLNI